MSLPRHFLDVATLRALIDAGQELVLFDCRFNLMAPHAGFQAYLSGHLPGARYAHLDKDLARSPAPSEGRHPLPDAEAFCRFLGASGVGPDTLVVAYDDAGGAIAARLWWLLGLVGHAQRALLDGGLQAWQTAGYPLEERLPAVETRLYRSGDSICADVLDTDDVADFITAGGTLLDARAAARFAGDQEPIDPVAGHVPGGTNLPFSDVLDSAGHLLDPAALSARLEQAVGGNRQGRIAAMCGSGVTACLLIAALEQSGFGPARLYAGSWSEWIRDSDRPVAKGQAGACRSKSVPY